MLSPSESCSSRDFKQGKSTTGMHKQDTVTYETFIGKINILLLIREYEQKHVHTFTL